MNSAVAFFLFLIGYFAMGVMLARLLGRRAVDWSTNSDGITTTPGSRAMFAFAWPLFLMTQGLLALGRIWSRIAGDQ